MMLLAIADAVVAACFTLLAYLLFSAGRFDDVCLGGICSVVAAKHWLVAALELAIAILDRRPRTTRRG